MVKKKPDLEASWLVFLEQEFEKPYMRELKRFLLEEKKRFTVFPPGKLIFNAFNSTAFERVRVVLLGQDPYHGPGQAQGLCFSVNRGVKPPPSLQNIYRELNQSLGVPIPDHGDLSHWAGQGVLLLNTTLTVRARAAKSHAGKGWETFTDQVIRLLDRERKGLVFVLWGRHAGEKEQLIQRERHLILKAAHPSPYSADRGFFGCGHFAKINRHLQDSGGSPIDWRLPP